MSLPALTSAMALALLLPTRAGAQGSERPAARPPAKARPGAEPPRETRRARPAPDPARTAARAWPATDRAARPVAAEATRPTPRAAASRGFPPAGKKRKPRWYRFEASFEMGFLGMVWHKVQFGRSGTYFDYVKEGGQDNLFLFLRLSAGVTFVQRHTVLFLYQPLTLKTRTLLARDIIENDVLFPAGTPVDLNYGFDFYRLSYMYDIFRAPHIELSFGVSLQIRNADISFTSVDGSLRSVSQGVGPVPLIKIRGRYTFRNGFWLGGEIDGIWAGSKIINGSTENFEGSLIDVSLRAGIHLLKFVDVFVNLRYVGGGALGTDEDETQQGDGYTRNWLHLITLSIGLGIY